VETDHTVPLIRMLVMLDLLDLLDLLRRWLVPRGG